MKINKDPARYFDEEIQWLHEKHHRDCGMEILETMTYEEAQGAIAPLFEKRISTQQAFNKKYKKIQKIANTSYAPGTFENEFLTNCIWAVLYAKEDIENKTQLEKLERYWLYNESRKPKLMRQKDHSTVHFHTLLQNAKRVPIENLYPTKFKRSGVKTLTTLCPFHSEKTPSFTVFTESNTFYCFGCDEHGDSIAFCQKYCGVDFMEAIRRLNGDYYHE